MSLILTMVSVAASQRDASAETQTAENPCDANLQKFGVCSFQF